MPSETVSPLPPKAQNRPDAVAYGRGLRQGLGVNLLVRDVPAEVKFLAAAFGVSVHYYDDDFAIVAGFGAEWMLHSDRSYTANPLLGVVRGSDEAGGVRGAGIELRLYGCDPDAAVERVGALIAGGVAAHILAAAMDKPHGQREAVVIDPEGYAWAPSLPI